MKIIYTYIFFFILIISSIIFYILNNIKKKENFSNKKYFIDIYDDLNDNVITPDAWYLFDEDIYATNPSRIIKSNINYDNYDKKYYFKRWSAEIEGNCLHKDEFKNLPLCSDSLYKASYYNLLNKLKRKDIPTQYIDRIGKYSLEFNGETCLETIYYNDHVNLNNDSFTICWWSYLNTKNIIGIGRWIYSKYICIRERCHGYRRGNAVHLGYRKINEFNFDFWEDEVKINIDINKHYQQWVFFAVTYKLNNNERYIYCFDNNNDIPTYAFNIARGSLTPASDIINNKIFDEYSKICMGCDSSRNGNAFFIGQIANFRIYKGVALSISQIKSIYKNQLERDLSQTENLNERASIYTPNFNYEVIKYPEISDIATPYDTYIYSVDNLNLNTPFLLFDGNIGNQEITSNSVNLGYSLGFNNYNANGAYIGNNSYRIENQGITINGEWILINFNNSFILSTYGFIAIRGLEKYAPGCWELWGIDDNRIYTRLDYNSEQNRLDFKYGNYNNHLSYYGVDSLDNNNLSFKKYLFIFTKLAIGRSNDNSNKTLKFIEILMFAKK